MCILQGNELCLTFSLCHGVHVLPCQFDSHGNSSRSNGYQKLAVGSDSDMHTILWKGEGYGNLQVGATSKTGEGGMENDADINLPCDGLQQPPHLVV